MSTEKVFTVHDGPILPHRPIISISGDYLAEERANNALKTSNVVPVLKHGNGLSARNDEHDATELHVHGRGPGTAPDHVYQANMAWWRYRIRKFLVSNLATESRWIAAMQKRVRTPWLDTYFVYTSSLGTHTFFLIILPMLFYFGAPETGRAFVQLLAAGVYLSSLIKDSICCPRPFAPPVTRLTMGDHHLEYGFPSTHSTNSISMALYLFTLLVQHWRSAAALAVTEGVPAGFSILTPGVFEGATFLLGVYAFSIVYGRIYCAMHSFTDCVVGVSLGTAIWAGQYFLGSMFDHWMTTPGWTVPVLTISLGALLVGQHADPVDDCPCFEDAIAFISVVMGTTLGNWHQSNFVFSSEASTYAAYFTAITPGSALQAPSDFLLFLSFSVMKMLFGITLIFIWRILAKSAFHLILPPLFRTLAGWFGALPNRRFYTPATDYKGPVPDDHLPGLGGPDGGAGLLKSIPSVIDIPHMLVENGSESEGATSSLSLPRYAPNGSARTRAAAGTNGKVTMKNGGRLSPPTLMPVSKEAETVTEKAAAEKHYDADVITKMIVYAGIGFIASDVTPTLFELFGWGYAPNIGGQYIPYTGNQIAPLPTQTTTTTSMDMDDFLDLSAFGGSSRESSPFQQQPATPDLVADAANNGFNADDFFKSMLAAGNSNNIAQVGALDNLKDATDSWGPSLDRLLSSPASMNSPFGIDAAGLPSLDDLALFANSFSNSVANAAAGSSSTSTTAAHAVKGGIFGSPPLSAIGSSPASSPSTSYAIVDPKNGGSDAGSVPPGVVPGFGHPGFAIDPQLVAAPLPANVLLRNAGLSGPLSSLPGLLTTSSAAVAAVPSPPASANSPTSSLPSSQSQSQQQSQAALLSSALSSSTFRIPSSSAASSSKTKSARPAPPPGSYNEDDGDDDEEDEDEEDDDEDMKSVSGMGSLPPLPANMGYATSAGNGAKPSASAATSAAASRRSASGIIQQGGITKTRVTSAVVALDKDPNDPDDWRPSPEEYKKLSSKEKRQLRNKISARNFRVRRKEYITTLESHIADRDRLIEAIRQELGASKVENDELRQEVDALKQALLEGRTTAEALALPPPAPLDANGDVIRPTPSPTPASRSTKLNKPNTRKDIAAPGSPAFWGGVGAGAFGGVTSVHATLVPDITLPTALPSPPSQAAKPVAPQQQPQLPKEQPRESQQNLNPRLNAPAPSLFNSPPSSDSELDSPIPRRGVMGSLAQAGYPGAQQQQQMLLQQQQQMSRFDAFMELNPFTNRSADDYKMQLWAQMAAAKTLQAHAQAQQQQEQQQGSQNRFAQPSYSQQQQQQQNNSGSDLLRSVKPAYFQGSSNSVKQEPTSPKSTLAALLSGKASVTSSSSSSSRRSASSPLAQSSSTAPQPTQQQAFAAALASQTLLSRMSSAFWDAFSGSSAPSSSQVGPSSSRMAAPARSWDAEKVRKVLEGRAVVRVVDVDPFTNSRIGTTIDEKRPAATTNASAELEEKMRGLTLAK
ncbi:hypothetical protein DL93DRAFT_2095035 [Clavulina sp. PMI_390]|nr:hypothetical protein DL93DRAFT_2095035 [Clavulina sp. PMI_390]